MTGHHSVIQGQFPPQAKPKISNFSPKNFLPRHFKKWVPPPQPAFFAARGRTSVTIYHGINKSYIMFLNVCKLRCPGLLCTWKHMTLVSITIFFYLARRRRKIFQIMYEKINFGQKIRVPPPGKIKIFSFLPKTYFSPGIFKSEFPPQAKPIAKSWFLPKILRRNDTITSCKKWETQRVIF